MTTDVNPPVRPIESATSAILAWSHRHGGAAHCLIQLRALQAPRGDLVAVVVASELRTNPRGRGATTDFAGLAAAAAARVVPAACRLEAVTWFLHHGSFSTNDHTDEPDTFTQVHLHWDPHTGYVDPGPEAHRLLADREAAQLTAELRLEDIDEVLRTWSWEQRADYRTDAR